MGRTLTGVSGILSCAHRDQQTGQLHGHTWEVTAWFPFNGMASEEGALRHRLGEVLKALDHNVLPDKLAWGEHIAEHIANQLTAWRHLISEPVAVDVKRPSERIFARWEA